MAILKRFFAAWMLGTLLPASAATADSVPMPQTPLRIEGLLRLGQEVTSDGRRISMSTSLALGMITFNSPYILGGDALRNSLTCNACHSPDGLSGSASAMTLAKPLPDLFQGRAHGDSAAADEVGIARFIRTALPREFQSQGVPEDIVTGLSVYLAGWRETAIQSPSSTAPFLHIGPWTMVSLAVQLARHSICVNDSARTDLMIETARFYLGTIDLQLTDQAARDAVRSLNRALHAADDDVLGNKLLSALSGLSSIESGLVTPSSEVFTVRLEPEVGRRRDRDQNGAIPRQTPLELRMPCVIQDSQL